MPDTKAANTHVVVIGAGFAGLRAARRLGRAGVDVTLVDRRNHHLFQPLLYQVATGALSPAEIAAPIRTLVRGIDRVHVVLDEVTGIDLQARTVRLSHRTLTYDCLVVATGVRHAYFGHDEWERSAPGLKTLEDAEEIRRRIFSAFEHAELENDAAAREALLRFVVVGGGPTGAELAGALAEISQRTLARDFRAIDPKTAHVLLLEAAPRILLAYPEALSSFAVRHLTDMGVEVRTSTPVTQVTASGVEAGGQWLAAHTVLWAAGVAASPLARSFGLTLDRLGRVPVAPDLSLPGRPEVYVVGDLAAYTLADLTTLPGLAPVAMQQGAWAAENILRRLRGESTTAFRYKDRGMLAVLGRGSAVGVIRRLRLKGLGAWLVWSLVHIAYLIGQPNRLLVLTRWLWGYVTYHRGARLITGPWRPGGP